MSEQEIADGRTTVVKIDQLSGQVTVQNRKAHGGGDKEKSFTFDTVFGCDTKQADLYNETARPIVEFVLEGYNGKGSLGPQSNAHFLSLKVRFLHTVKLGRARHSPWRGTERCQRCEASSQIPLRTYLVT